MPRTLVRGYLQFQKSHSLLKALIPMDTAVGDVIEEGIKLCNGREDFLDVYYYVTNVKKPGKKDIAEYLRERKSAMKANRTH